MGCSEKCKCGWVPVKSGVYPDDGEIVQITFLRRHNNEPCCYAFAYRFKGKWHWYDIDEFFTYSTIEQDVVAWKRTEPYKE